MREGRIFAFFGSLVLAAQVSADTGCSFSEGSTTLVSYSLPNLSVPSDTPIGTLIYTARSASSAQVKVWCGSTHDEGVKGSRGAIVSPDGILPLGDSGLGYKLYSNWAVDAVYPKSSPWGSYGMAAPYVLEIYKISEVKGSTIPGGVFANYYVGSLNVYVASITSDIKLEPLSCEVPGVTVQMGEHQVSDFLGQGSKVGMKNFNVGLVNCGAGISKVSYMMNGADGDYFLDSGVIKLSGGGASGVGLQISRDGVPVKMGEWFSDFPAPIKGSNSYGFSASYYQISKDVIAGDASAALRITVKYF